MSLLCSLSMFIVHTQFNNLSSSGGKPVLRDPHVGKGLLYKIQPHNLCDEHTARDRQATPSRDVTRLWVTQWNDLVRHYTGGLTSCAPRVCASAGTPRRTRGRRGEQSRDPPVGHCTRHHIEDLLHMRQERALLQELLGAHGAAMRRLPVTYPWVT